MAKFSRRSLSKLRTCDERIQLICLEAIELYDFSIIHGHRGEHLQNELFRNQKSELKWPDSKHNYYPSLAIDVAPYPIDWDDINRFYYLAGLLSGIAHKNGFMLQWGGNWESLKDYGHFELLD